MKRAGVEDRIVASHPPCNGSQTPVFGTKVTLGDVPPSRPAGRSTFGGRVFGRPRHLGSLCVIGADIGVGSHPSAVCRERWGELFHDVGWNVILRDLGGFSAAGGRAISLAASDENRSYVRFDPI